MKKSFLSTVILCIISIQCAFSDIPQVDRHRPNMCVKITNINEFPTISLIRYTDGFGSISSFIIEPNTCFGGGYQFHRRYIYATHKSYITGKELNSIKFTTDKNLRKSSIYIDGNAEYVSNSNPLNNIQEFYKIMGFSTDSTVVLHKWKAIYSFSNGKKDSTVNYSEPAYSPALSADFTAPTPVSSPMVSAVGALSIYPNPAKDNVYVRIENDYEGEFDMKIMNIAGKTMSDFKFHKDNYSFTCLINTELLHKGVYILKISLANKTETRKLIIN
jgi:hypothetical protein